jgi:ubiquinone/menaquinone biosynthesis C-methylase UbiE
MQTADSIKTRYDDVAPAYDERDAKLLAQKLYWLTYEHLTWAPVAALLPKDRAIRVLDAGGGSGVYGLRMAERGHHVTVLDLSPGMLAKARERFAQAGLLRQAQFREGNILELPFADAEFDLVFCEGDPVSYCQEQHPRALRELVRVARTCAPVVLGVDNRYAHFLNTLYAGRRETALDALLAGKGTCPYGLPVHAFTLPELRAAVEAAGARVDEIFGKPVLFHETLEALSAARGAGFSAWDARAEVLELQAKLAHDGAYAALGGHFQVMARRK